MNQRKSLWLRMSVLLVLLAAFLVVIARLHASLANDAADLSQTRLATAAAEVQERDFQLQKAEFARVTETVQSTDAYFIREQNVLAFITALEDIARKAQVQQEITNLPVPPVGTHQSTMEVRLKGGVPRVAFYLQSLEQLPYYVNVQRMTMNGSSGGANESDEPPAGPTTTISATVYWL